MLDFPPPLDRRPAQVAPAETPGLRGLLTVAVTFVVVAGLYLGRSVLIPFTLAVLLSFLLAPLVNLLRRGHLGRVPSVLLAMLLALAVILALGGLIGTQVAGLADDVPRYVFTIQQKVDTVQQVVLSRMATFTSSLVRQPAHSDVTAKPGAAPAGTSPAGTRPAAAPSAAAQTPIPVEVHQPDQTVVQVLPAYRHAGCRTAVHHGHRVHRLDLHPAAARGSAGSDDPAVRLLRPAPHHGRDERRGATAVALPAHPACREHGVRRDHRHGAGHYRHPLAGDLGRSRRVAALRALYRRAALRRDAAGAGGGRRSRLVQAAVDRFPLPRGGAAHGPGGRAAALWPQHRALAVRRRAGGDVLDLAVGADRADPVHPADALPGGARAACGAAGVSRRAARRPPGADAGGKLLSAHPGGRSRRGA